MTAKQMAQAELVALQQIVDGLKDADTEALEKEIAQAKRIFVGGAGRSLLSMKGFAMRLMQTGHETYLVGEVCTPSVQPGDLLIVGSGSGETKVTLDVEGYRAKREATLRALARRTAVKVKKYRRSVTLEPMNPYERRIIHSELQGFDGVTTYSVGQDSGRRVVVSLADETGAAIGGQGAEKTRRSADAPRNPVGYRTPRPDKKPAKKKSVASYFGDEEYTDDYMLDEKGEPLDIAKICGIYDDPAEESDAPQTEEAANEE